MTTETNKNEGTPANVEAKEKPGFFTRIFTKLDTAMKEKADAQSSCCPDKGGKNGKCC